MDFYQKYIKYKNKYLSLKKAIKGGVGSDKQKYLNSIEIFKILQLNANYEKEPLEPLVILDIDDKNVPSVIYGYFLGQFFKILIFNPQISYGNIQDLIIKSANNQIKFKLSVKNMKFKLLYYIGYDFEVIFDGLIEIININEKLPYLQKLWNTDLKINQTHIVEEVKKAVPALTQESHNEPVKSVKPVITARELEGSDTGESDA